MSYDWAYFASMKIILIYLGFVVTIGSVIAVLLPIIYFALSKYYRWIDKKLFQTKKPLDD